MKERALPGIVIIILILAGGVAYVAWERSHQVPPPVEEISVPGVDYTNESLGISFIQPDGYVLDSRGGNGDEYRGGISLINEKAYDELTTSTEPREVPPSILISVYEPNEFTSIEGWVSENTREIGYTGTPLTPTTVAGESGVTFSGEGLYERESVAVTHGERVYLFTVEFLESTDPVVSDFTQLLTTVSFK